MKNFKLFLNHTFKRVGNVYFAYEELIGIQENTSIALNFHAFFTR